MFQRMIVWGGLMIGLLGIGLVAGASAQADKCNDPGPFPKAEEFVAVDKAPELFSEATPIYPPEEKAKGIEGLVWVKALVDKCGKVKEAMVAKTSGVKVLDEAALTAARQNEFIPAESKGEPVACWVTYKVEFKLTEDDATAKVKPKPSNRDWESEGYPSPEDSLQVDVMPEMLSAANPVYPMLCKTAGITGIVWITALVDRTGTVREAAVAKSSSNSALDEAALKAAHGCRFKAARSNGQPVACWVTYKVEFKLDK
jgi:TonB family protein